MKKSIKNKGLIITIDKMINCYKLKLSKIECFRPL